MKRFLAVAVFLLAAFPAAAQTKPGSNNFLPDFGAGVALSTSTTSASATVPAADTDLIIWNSGTTTVFCRWGVGAQTALTSDMPIPSGTVQAFTKRNGETTVACIAASGTPVIQIMPGFGS